MKDGVWNGGLGPHQPFHSGSSCHPGGPNFPAPMISAPNPTSCRRAKASSTPPAPPGWPALSFHHRVANIHSCSLSPAWPNGASRLWPSPVPKPSSEIEKLWTRASDMARAPWPPGLAVPPVQQLDDPVAGGGAGDQVELVGLGDAIEQPGAFARNVR